MEIGFLFDNIDPFNAMAGFNFHHLMYFRAIATEGSISKASEKLGVGQPALSSQLKQLETFFDQRLFERKSRKLILTDAGKAALKYANQIHDLGGELNEVLQNKQYTSRVHLQIGALDSVPKHLITALVAEAKQMAECTITVVEGDPDFLSRELMAHSVDLAVSNHPVVPSGDRTIFSRSLGRVPISLFGAQKFKDLKKNFPLSLNGQPLILPTSHSKLRHDLEHFFESQEIAYNVSAETQDTAVQKILCAEGVGLMASPRFAMGELLRAKKVVEIQELKGVYEEFFLLSTKRVVDNPLARKLGEKFTFLVE